jgi:hypothetical protein
MNDTLQSNIKLFQCKNTALAVLYASRSKHVNAEYPEVDLIDTEQLCVYGLGSGDYYYRVEDWLRQKENRLVFIEDDVEVLRSFCESEHAEKVLKNSRVQVCYLPYCDLGQFSGCRIQIIASKDYQSKPVFHKLSKDILEISALNDYLVNSDVFHNTIFFKNLYHNSMALPQSFRANGLFNHFKNVPAIICGAGPSLNKNIQFLKTLKNKSLILAGGSAINVLDTYGVSPNFVLGIDPTTNEAQGFGDSISYEVPHVYRLRLNPEALKIIHGPKLYVSGTGWFPIEGWVEESMGLGRGNFDEGYSVTCFAVEYAKALGCSPIIFVGVDLAYTDMKEYPEGLKSPASSAITKEKHNWWGSAKVKDIYGNDVYTKWRWVVEADYISKVQRSPEHLFINSTEGGMGVGDVPNISLKEVAAKYLQKQYDWSSYCHQEQQQLKTIDNSKASFILKELHESLGRCDLLYQDLLEEILEFSERKNDGWWTDNGKVALLQVSLEEEVAYSQLLHYFEEPIDRHLKKQNKNLYQDVQKISILKRKIEEHQSLISGVIF